ncbi:hypothetical protein DNU06_06090 [Putridiphycobacter roseus]|uniref:Outer membrane protein beta-barrel domain-containing protein n=1 Tax=Putridiphycobacter roseus TaxID=2219161 RepID=A0A2W1N4Z8_9FLAO|nr:outer membrane beta-barrel protein [Putridiphycobacter roseus]PZE18181.1 hypothetical protein DNU06_06090 [Putridiphycobacter roseus]
MRKITLLFLFIWLGSGLNAQNMDFGLSIAPTYNFQIFRSTPNNIWSSQTGNGFLFGGFIQKPIGEHSFIASALKFEYFGFNQKYNGYLAQSYRVASIHIPILFKQEIGLTKNWFYEVGLGVNYHFLSRKYSGGFWLNVNELANKFQPHTQIGLSYYSPQNRYELSAYGRYYFIDLWKGFVQESSQTKTKLITFELALKYYLNK